jgi:hypothetical protein
MRVSSDKVYQLLAHGQIKSNQMVGGSLQVLRLLPPLKLVAMILLKVALNTINQIKSLIHINKICNFVQLSEHRYTISSV